MAERVMDVVYEKTEPNKEVTLCYGVTSISHWGQTPFLIMRKSQH